MTERHYDDGQVTFLLGDVRDVLREMPAESVNMCVTSPPYWGLRDYGTATWDGGRYECDECQVVAYVDDLSSGCPKCGRTMTPVECDHLGKPSDVKNSEGREPMGDTCGKCGAKRIDQQLGLERTPEEYVAKMVDVFRDVRRVLRPDGTLWLNIGDSYASNPASGGLGQQDGGEHQHTPRGEYLRPAGMKPKDLVGIPWTLAFALRADGWYLRQDIIWAKPNPMPESVRDRCTKAHEYLFLLSKSERYYYDADAIREPAAYGGEQLGIVRGLKVRAEAMGRKPSGNEVPGADAMAPERRNKRSVWNIATAPYAEAHFATFPPALVEPCILAGCPEGGIVLDPFIGSGTTALVARRLGRKAIGIDLNAEYLDMAVRRAGGQLAMEMTR